MSDLYHTVVLGNSGAGKSSVSLQAAMYARRSLVIDSSADPIWHRHGPTTDDPEAAVRWVWDNPTGPWHLNYLGDAESALVVMEALYEAQDREGAENVLLVAEEATTFSSPFAGMPPELEAVVSRGRRRGIVLWSIAQEETQIAKRIRRLQFLTVTLQQDKDRAPADTRDAFAGELEELERLRTVTPDTAPVYGRHYLTRPAGRDPIQHVIHALRSSPPDPLPPTWEPPQLP